MINRDRVLERFLEYIKINSESYHEGDFAKRLKGDLEKLGLSVKIDKTGEKVGSNTGNIIARLKGNAKGETILFSCHMDTVSPGQDIKPIVKEGVVYSDGTTILGGDDKGGIASIIEALTIIKEKKLKHPDIEIIFTIAEEVGMYGSKNLDYSEIKAKKAFIFDTSGDPGAIVIKGPAQDKILVKILGKPAHAGVAPEQGISAIQIAAEAISKMKLLRIDKDTTANIGKISGGVATNVVCPEVIIEAEARSTDVNKLDEQTKHMIKVLESTTDKFGGRINIEVNRLYGAFVVEEDSDIVVHAKSAFKKLNMESKTMASGGGSDTNIFNGNGITAINLSSGERKPHTLEEHMRIEDLVTTAKVVIELINESLSK